MLLDVATGTMLEVVGVTTVVVGARVAEQAKTVVEVEAEGAVGPVGGFLFLQLETEQLPPGQEE